jgi:protoporphyrinogen oxidase
MEDGYINQFGRTLYEVFFKRYSEKLWGQDCNSISIDWVGQRTRGLDIFTIVKDTFLKSKNIVSLVDEFSYPKDGIGRISEKLSEEIRKKKGAVHTDSEVLEVKHHNQRIESVVVEDKGKKKIISGEYFISSIPLDDLVVRLKPQVKADIIGLAKRLKFRDEIQVALFIKKPHITPDTWIYIHPKEIPFMRVMEMDNWSSKLSPKGSTTLVFEIACSKDDRVWKRKDSEIIDLVVDGYIKEFSLIERKDVLGGYVYRALKEYPVYHLGYREDVSRIKTYLKRFENLQIIGRAGTFRYNNMDHSIEMGLYAAWNILSGEDKYDIESVNIEREYLEEKKIENIEDELVEGREED